MANAHEMNVYVEHFPALLLAVALLVLASSCADSDGAGVSSHAAASSETAPSEIVPPDGAAARETAARETAAREVTRGGAGGAPSAQARAGAADSSCNVPAPGALAPGALVDPACFRAILPENLHSRGWEQASFTAETTADFHGGTGLYRPSGSSPGQQGLRVGLWHHTSASWRQHRAATRAAGQETQEPVHLGTRRPVYYEEAGQRRSFTIYLSNNFALQFLGSGLSKRDLRIVAGGVLSRMSLGDVVALAGSGASSALTQMAFDDAVEAASGGAVLEVEHLRAFVPPGLPGGWRGWSGAGSRGNGIHQVLARYTREEANDRAEIIDVMVRRHYTPASWIQQRDASRQAADEKLRLAGRPAFYRRPSALIHRLTGYLDHNLSIVVTGRGPDASLEGVTELFRKLPLTTLAGDTAEPARDALAEAGIDSTSIALWSADKVFEAKADSALNARPQVEARFAEIFPKTVAGGLERGEISSGQVGSNPFLVGTSYTNGAEVINVRLSASTSEHDAAWRRVFRASVEQKGDHGPADYHHDETLTEYEGHTLYHYRYAGKQVMDPYYQARVLLPGTRLDLRAYRATPEIWRDALGDLPLSRLDAAMPARGQSRQ